MKGDLYPHEVVVSILTDSNINMKKEDKEFHGEGLEISL
jgi:hypothetical protein